MTPQPQFRALSAWTPADGVRLHTRILRPAGRSRGLVVMVHGLGVSAASLGPLAERLAERRTVVVCDVPGFGRSRARGIWTSAGAAAAVALAMERRGLGRADLVGHSWGCHIAAMLALREPARARSLILLSPAFARGRGTLGEIARLLLDAPMERPALVAGGVRDYLRAGPRRVLATLREAAGIPLDDLVARVSAPVLIVRGSRDPLTPQDWAATLARRAPRAALAVIPGAAHGLGHDAPRATAAAIETFLEDVHPSRMAGRP